MKSTTRNHLRSGTLFLLDIMCSTTSRITETLLNAKKTTLSNHHLFDECRRIVLCSSYTTEYCPDRRFVTVHHMVCVPPKRKNDPVKSSFRNEQRRIFVFVVILNIVPNDAVWWCVYAGLTAILAGIYQRN